MADEEHLARPEPLGHWEYEICGDVISRVFVPDDPIAFAGSAKDDERAARISRKSPTGRSQRD
jgi:hypothetical protein